MSYFDAAEAYDKTLLHPDVRTHDDLTRIAAIVEERVIEEFRAEHTAPLPAPITGNEGLCQYLENSVYHTVFLWGYRPDAADSNGYNSTRSAWTGFAAAMRATIADVVSHRLVNYDEDTGIKSESHGRESWEYTETRDIMWPRNWDWRLRKYVPKGYDPRSIWGL